MGTGYYSRIPAHENIPDIGASVLLDSLLDDAVEPARALCSMNRKTSGAMLVAVVVLAVESISLRVVLAAALLLLPL